MPSLDHPPGMARSPDELLEQVRRRARQLTRRRRLVVIVPVVSGLIVGMVALVSATTSKQPTVVFASRGRAHTSTTATATTSTTARTSVAATPTTLTFGTCASNQVRIIFSESQASGGLGFGQFTVQNTSLTPCTVEGFPAIDLLDNQNVPLPTQLTHQDPRFSGKREQQITLVPSGLAGFDATWPEYRGTDSCALGSPAPPTAASLRITLPGALDSLIIPAKSRINGLPIQACDGRLRVSFLYPTSQ